MGYIKNTIQTICILLMLGTLVFSHSSFAKSSLSGDQIAVPNNVCSGDGGVEDYIWNIAIGDIDVVFGGSSGWSDEIAVDGFDFIFVNDIDGNGNEDIVLTDGTMPWEERVGPRTGAIYFNNGDGTFTLAAGDRPMNEFARRVLFEDFDGDERTDIFILDHGWDAPPFPGFPNQLLLNKESGFVDASATHLPDNNADFSHGGAAGDVDKDGDLDVFVSNANNNESYFLINDGTGHFTRDTSRLPAEFLTDITLPPLSVKLVDLDQDGFVDMGTGNWFGHPNVIYWGNAEGVFSSDAMTALPNPYFYADSHDVPSFEVQDFNGDGKPDLLLGFYSGNLEDGTQILINQGNRTFADETLKRLGNSAYTGPNQWPAVYRFFDFNGDGTVDILPSYPSNSLNLAWLNDGTGHYAPITRNMYNKPDAAFRFSSPYVVDVAGFSAIEWVYGDGLLQMNEGVVTVNPVLTHSGTGSDGRDFITGSICGDNINAGAGDDRIDSNHGNDVLIGGPGNDELNDWSGDDKYILNAEDLTGGDVVWDYGGYDTLVFADFGLDRVTSVAQVGGGDLQFNFADGGGITIIAHFGIPGQAVERLRAGGCYYDITQDQSFTSGAIETALGDCKTLGNPSGSLADAQINYPYFEDDRYALTTGLNGVAFNSGFTFSGWFYFKKLSDQFGGIAGTNWESFGIDSDPGGDITVWFKQSAANFANIEMDQWVNIAVSAGQGQVLFYKNGVLMDQVDMVDTSVAFPDEPGAEFFAGRFWGYAKQFKIWGRALSQEELQEEIAVASSITNVPMHQWLMDEGVGSVMQDTGILGGTTFNYTDRVIWKNAYSPYEILLESEIKIHEKDRILTGSATWGSADFNQDGRDEVFLHGGNDDYYPDYPPIPMLILQVDENEQLVDASASMVDGGFYYRRFSSGRDTIIADLNGDGFDDIFSAVGGGHLGVITPDSPTLLLSQGESGFLVPSEDRIMSPPCILPSPMYEGQKPCEASDSGGIFYPDENAPLVPINLFSAGHGNSAGDIDRDGDLDLYVQTIYGGERDDLPVSSHFLINDGAGNFTLNWQMVPHKALMYDVAYFEEGELPGQPEGTIYVKDQYYNFGKLGDLDKDGYLDMVLICRWGEAAELLPPKNPFDVETETPQSSIYELIAWGDESGFSEEYSILWPKQLPGSQYRGSDTPPFIVDIDSDGDDDLIINRVNDSGYPGSWLQVFRNNGGRVFEDITSESIPQTLEDINSRPRSVGLEPYDFNKDGCTDFIATQDFPAPDLNGLPPFRVWQNDCNGKFTPVKDSFFGKVGMMIPLDIDGDGGLDFVSINRGVDTEGKYYEATILKQVAPLNLQVFGDRIFASAFEAIRNKEMPNLLGLQRGVAEEIISLIGFQLGDVNVLNSESLPQGQVMAQQPLPGARVVAGETVNLSVSRGYIPVTVPNVVGLQQAAADSAIAGANLTPGVVTGQESATLAAGVVISQSPSAGTAVEPGTLVDLVASVGSAGVVVPNVVGLKQENAESAITASTLNLGSASLKNSNEVAEGIVISQSPPAGTPTSVGWPVNIVVSSGIGRSVTYDGPEPVDPGLIDELPVDVDSGLPIVFTLNELDLVIDLNKQDPITGMAACMDWVLGCVNPISDRDLDDCVTSAPNCSTAEPWLEEGSCCPNACATQYESERLSGSSQQDAFTQVFLIDPNCYPGLQEMMP